MQEQQINPTHSFLVEDAIRLGSVEKAILLKEIRTFNAYKVRHEKEPWVYYSGKSLTEKFPYLKQRSIERWLTELVEAKELAFIIKNKFKYDQTKSYTVPYFLQSVRQKGESKTENGETIPPLPSPLPKDSDVETSHTSFKDFMLAKNYVEGEKYDSDGSPHQWWYYPNELALKASEISNLQREHQKTLKRKESAKKGVETKKDLHTPQNKALLTEFCQIQNIKTLDHGNSYQDVAEFKEIFHRHLTQDLNLIVDTDEGLIKQFKGFLKQIEASSHFHWKNLTSFKYLNRNFNKIIRDLK